MKRSLRASGCVPLFALAFSLLWPSPGRCLDNLIRNPGFLTPAGGDLAPFSWEHGTADVAGVRPSGFSVGRACSPPLRALGVTGGEDRAGEWWSTVEGLEKGKSYRLAFKACRMNFVEGAYPEVEAFGQRTRLSNMFSYRGWQDIELVFTASADTTGVKFINNYPETFYFAAPSLTAAAVPAAPAPPGAAGRCTPVMPGVFPLVAYGADVRDLAFIKDLGFNGAVVSVNMKTVRGVVDAAARDAVQLVVRTADEETTRVLADAGVLWGWYVEDEPEGRSEPAAKIRAGVQRIRDAGSCRPTFMAMVRSEFVQNYRDVADVILMDQYPVPTNSLVWLSKSMAEARRAAGGEVWAVVQIFGGQGWQKSDWKRTPTFEEMKALSYLAVVHGARGLFFYTVKDQNFDVKLDPPHLADVRRLMRELAALGPWFLGTPQAAPAFAAAGLHVFAPDGSPPIHACRLLVGGREVVIAVNVLDKPVQGKLAGLTGGVRIFKEHFSGRKYLVKDLNILDEFDPYEVKIYVAADNPGN